MLLLPFCIPDVPFTESSYNGQFGRYTSFPVYKIAKMSVKLVNVSFNGHTDKTSFKRTANVSVKRDLEFSGRPVYGVLLTKQAF